MILKTFYDQVINKYLSRLTHKNENKYDTDKLFHRKIIVETNYILNNLDVKPLKIKERVLKDFKFINSKIFKQIIPFFQLITLDF